MLQQKFVRQFIIVGIALGYSDESIIHYLRRRYDASYPKIRTPITSPFYGTGYIATEEDLLDPDETIRLINSRRLVSTPFPKLHRHELEDEAWTAMKLNPVVAERCPVIVEKLSGFNLVR